LSGITLLPSAALPSRTAATFPIRRAGAIRYNTRELVDQSKMLRYHATAGAAIHGTVRLLPSISGKRACQPIEWMRS